LNLNEISDIDLGWEILGHPHIRVVHRRFLRTLKHVLGVKTRELVLIRIPMLLLVFDCGVVGRYEFFLNRQTVNRFLRWLLTF
jgi:hypothetical protein